jgi:hypothetical protein
MAPPDRNPEDLHRSFVDSVPTNPRTGRKGYVPSKLSEERLGILCRLFEIESTRGHRNIETGDWRPIEGMGKSYSGKVFPGREQRLLETYPPEVLAGVVGGRIQD